MRSPVLALALVGLVFGARQPGWKDHTEYVYRVDGRSLTSLNELADQYSGIFIKAKLHVSPRSDGKLQAWISESQYAQIHSQMPNGWNSEIPESQLNFKQLGLSKKPFQIISQNGLIKSLVVEKDVANWEANVIKSIVSQFQLDLQGKRAVESHATTLPNDEKMEAVFQTMEDTVTGETETNYDIHQLPEYLVDSQPWLVPQQQLQGHGKIYEVLKSKNYTTNRAMPAYQYGFGEVQEGKPTGNRMGDFLTRSALSRVVLTGQLSKYTIQSSQTVNKIIINPTLNGKQRGSAVSSLNMTLVEVKSQTKQPQEMSSPIDIGNLVYTYEHPFASSNKVQRKLQGKDLASGESEEHTPRGKRSLLQSIKKSILGEHTEANSEEQVQYQMRPQMEESPESPLLPYYMGYHGKSIKANSDFDVKETAQRMSREISDDLAEPDQILTQSTLSKYAMLVSLVRLMNQKEIRAVTQQLYKPEQQQQQGSWMTFRDAVSEAGTGPAFLAIEEWISTKKAEKGEAAELVASMANSVRVPTEEYMQKFFSLTQNPEVMSQEQLNETSVLSFTRLLNKVYAKKTESQNQFPASSFRSFYTKDGKDFVKTVVIPYLSQQLDEAVMQADSRKIHVAIRALGSVGDKKVLEAFEPYLEGQKQASQYQRMLMILCLDKLVESNPTTAQAVMYRIYQNVGEVPEVRVAAVYQLMRTNPSAQMLQRMAQSTNVDAQEDVNAAVKSAIESLSQLEAAESQSL
ncbi:hypothetical protein HUJ05_002996 [Dendroctonus ponderosae]|nr:hypothetical protein HUJ05_002996 [Dendroctonus ponderosae]